MLRFPIVLLASGTAAKVPPRVCAWCELLVQSVNQGTVPDISSTSPSPNRSASAPALPCAIHSLKTVATNPRVPTQPRVRGGASIIPTLHSALAAAETRLQTFSWVLHARRSLLEPESPCCLPSVVPYRYILTTCTIPT